jgi:chemotaxis protein MotB
MSDGHSGGHKRRGGHDEEHEEHENHERWLVSYADMMTLLMVLFIVMFAISQVDQRKFAALKTGLTAGFGAPVAMLNGADQLLDPGGSVAPDSVNLAGSQGGQVRTPEINPAAAVNPQAVAQLNRAMQRAGVAKEVANLEKARKQLQAALTKASFPKGATFRYDERGLVVTIATDKLLFDSGSAHLLPSGRRILDALAPSLAKLPNKLSVDGHTNAIPIHNAQYPSNWELSAARAVGVLRYLAGVHGLSPDQLSATGFADTHPLLPASDPRSVSANRRVEIVILARLDGSAGRAVQELGTSKQADSGTGGSGSGTGGSDPAGTDPATADASADPSATDPSGSPSATPSG